MKIDGQCHCGHVTYRADIDPQQVSICHCTDCQALTGSPYRVTVICSGEQHPDERETRRKSTPGPATTAASRFQQFPAERGSPLFTSGEGAAPNDWGIRWGSIRQREEACGPMRQIWCRSAVPWINDSSGYLPGRPT